MLQIEFPASARDRALALQPSLERVRGLVHVIDIDLEARRALSRWSGNAGLNVQTHSGLSEFLDAPRAETPECLVADVRTLDVGRSMLRTRCPVIATAQSPDIATVVAAMKIGAIDFVERPLREREIVAAISAALMVDHEHRRLAARQAEVLERFSKLSRRERQVMALVTAGHLNKQTGGILGLSEITVKAHRGAVMRKMGARTFVDLVRMADNVCEDIAALRNDCLAQARSAADGDLRMSCSLAQT